jgi:hypothetical protein
MFDRSNIMSSAWLATAGALSIPHILYAFTWTRPKAFKKYLVKKGRDPVDQFAEYAHILKGKHIHRLLSINHHHHLILREGVVHEDKEGIDYNTLIGVDTKPRISIY